MNRNGTALLILMFAILCLSIFSLISFTSSRADRRAAEAGSEFFKAYYEADVLAEQVLAELLTESSPSENILGVEIHNSEDILSGTRVVSFASPVQNETELYVEAELSPEGYKILEWRLRDGGEWETDTGLPVWQGGEEENINTGLPSWLTD